MALFFRMLGAWTVSVFAAIGSIFGVAPNVNEVNMMAHRGYSFRYPDNTAVSFTQAAKHGAEGVETDLRITKDGIYVLSHDDVAVFKDGTKMNISESTYAELSAKPLRNTKSPDEVYLCSFYDFLKIMKEYNLEYYIEFKVGCTEELIRDVFTIAGKEYDISKCIYESPRIEDLILARGIFDDLPIMYVISDKSTDYSVCFEYNLSADVRYEILSKEMIGEFHSHGLKVGAWTCDTPFQTAYAKSLGVDYIESNVFCK